MNVREAYSQWSATYDQDRNLTRDLDQVVTRNALANLSFKSVLEIGCGTGKNTNVLAGAGEQVCSLDFSIDMIAKARVKVRMANVAFAVADITTSWPCRDRAFDLVSCNLVLEHVENLAFIFAEAARVLIKGGRFFICELHPFRQYRGVRANFQREEVTTEVDAFVHHLSDFTGAANENGLSMTEIREWWHEDDEGKPPRLVSFMFEKRS
jgi:ubiquinone/menaquinone biosynthesis C-methylase UbiE